ncbi:hypothetical protein BCR42DRAFT_444346 [Absidia repens]|uniref:Uncharacterized protein n=1 Tax=Absidia repens TaxID=90262 RepID=A0A1X2HX05_9FUNG|nr:hypothetical protein BCR42DRAFT_444346 [Absidia repens]
MWSNSAVLLKPTFNRIGNIICCSSDAAEDETLLTFIKFDFIYHACSATLDNNNRNNNNALTKAMCEMDSRRFSSNLVYLHLHHTLICQLNQHTFLEMILNPKPAKMDRFYSILLLLDYKDKLVNKNEVGQWHSTTMVSVKL